MRNLSKILLSLLLLLVLSPLTRACPPLLVSNGFVGSSFVLTTPFQATSTVFVLAPTFSTVGFQNQSLVNPFASYGVAGVGVGVPAFSPGFAVSPFVSGFNSFGLSSFGFNPFFRSRAFVPGVGFNSFAFNPFFRSRAFGYNAGFNPFFGRVGFRGAAVAPRAAVTRTRSVTRVR